jgi:hypothetical protein
MNQFRIFLDSIETSLIIEAQTIDEAIQLAEKYLCFDKRKETELKDNPLVGLNHIENNKDYWVRTKKRVKE